MSEQPRTVAGLLSDIAADICNNYCKYPERYSEKEYERQLNEVCSSCPLNKLGL